MTHIESLAVTLAVEPIGTDVFRPTAPSRLATADARGSESSRADDRRRVFGGQLLGQGLRAACATVGEGRLPRSLHAYFIAAADAGGPLDYHVERVRDGRGVSHRRVRAVQGAREVFSLEASFDAASAGFAYEDRPSPGAGPDELPTASGEAAQPWSGVQMKFAEAGAGAHTAHRRFWMRAAQPLGSDPVLHACALAYMSDLSLLRAALEPDVVQLADRPIRLASLDHAIWFHRTSRADSWVLCDSISPVAHGGRALALGHLFDPAGRLVLTVAQQGTLRLRPEA
ncbi:acyl-CoA thioesterase [Dactylosporangium sucinum]|uniref:Acyl-CoA thioesterase II n=1 Tax=Dactylosporangium sucinum TaxID=1424081 RepID=A0A917UBE1_9ACTN|nr:acyl-CoA thioesterase domain-containing protein [Dactylosporangium sucinum]GGM76098.1 acyl-CoA thioesterase II [Dactylosporangium sucinum]